MSNLVEIHDDQERAAFRIFAAFHPAEAAEVNWPEFVAMAKDLNPEITEDALRGMLSKLEAAEKGSI